MIDTIQIDKTEKLVNESKLGDRKSQFELYKLYSKAMYNICLRFMTTREEAEDMLQEAFIYAFKHLDSFRFDSTFGAWLRRIVINRCINELKRRKSNLKYFDDLAPFATKYVDEEDQGYMEGISVDHIKMAMDALPKGSRIIFSLYLLEGYDHQEISQILEISESNSKTQYMRAKQKVKDILTQMRYEN